MLRNSLATAILALAVVACSDSDKQAAADAELAHDIALANQTPANPLFRDTAIAIAPETRPAPRPPARTTKTAAAPRRAAPDVAPPRAEPVATVEPSAPAPRTRGFSSGTTFSLATKSPICTTNLPGDKIVATVTSPVSGENGAHMPAGTTVVLEVASVTPGDTPESAQISLRVRSILLGDETVSMEGDVAILSELERREVPRDKNADRRKVVTGAVAGAIIGQIMGKDTKSTVIGAAAGAAAGTAAAAASRKYDACLPAGGTVRVTTSQPVVVSD